MSINNKIQIVLFVRSFLKGGAEKQSMLLAEYLSNYYKIYLVAFCNDGKLLERLNPSINIVILDGHIIKKAIRLYKLLISSKVTHMFNYLPVNNIMGIMIGKIAGVKYLYGGIRGTRKKGKVKNLISRILCNYISSAYISNSYAAAKSYTEYGYKKEKILVIHNAIGSRNNAKKTNPNVVILSIGRFVEEKDYITALKTVWYLINNNPDYENKITYNIVGYGPKKSEIIEAIKLYNLEKIVNLNITGQIGENYEKADIFLSTSIHEGMPNVIMEAMSHALPVIATEAGDVSYLVVNGENGFVCSAGDYQSLAAKLKLLISDNKLRKEMGECSQKKINESYIPDKVFVQYRQLIESNIE